MQFITSLTPERAQQHAEEMSTITDAELSLARHLQQVAFWGRRDYTGFDMNFQPAPLYVTQAIVLSREIGAMAGLMTCISGLVDA